MLGSLPLSSKCLLSLKTFIVFAKKIIDLVKQIIISESFATVNPKAGTGMLHLFVDENIKYRRVESFLLLESLTVSASFSVPTITTTTVILVNDDRAKAGGGGGTLYATAWLTSVLTGPGLSLMILLGSQDHYGPTVCNP